MSFNWVFHLAFVQLLSAFHLSSIPYLSASDSLFWIFQIHPISSIPSLFISHSLLHLFLSIHSLLSPFYLSLLFLLSFLPFFLPTFLPSFPSSFLSSYFPLSSLFSPFLCLLPFTYSFFSFFCTKQSNRLSLFLKVWHSFFSFSFFFCQVDPLTVKWCAILHNNRAAAYLSDGHLKECLSDCNEAILKDPNYSKAYLRRARVYRVGRRNC